MGRQTPASCTRGLGTGCRMAPTGTKDFWERGNCSKTSPPFLAYWDSGNRIIAARMKRVATTNPFDSQPAALDRTVFDNGPTGVFAACWPVAAMRAEPGRDGGLIKPDEGKEDMFEAPGEILPGHAQCMTCTPHQRRRRPHVLSGHTVERFGRMTGR